MSRNSDGLRIISVEKLEFTEKDKLIKFYKKGYSLGELSRYFHIDFSLILFIVRKAKIKRRRLFSIYENQNERKECQPLVGILEKEKNYLEKYFPDSNINDITNCYYWYWRDRWDKTEVKKNQCEHKVKHVSCALCNKILGDATGIPIKYDTECTGTQNIGII